MKTKRCFISIELSREVINEIKNIQNLIRKKNMFIGKFTEPENLHLTLKFLGEIDEYKISKVMGMLKSVEFNEFEAELGDVGVFSKKFSKNPRFFVPKNYKNEKVSDIKIIWVELLGKVFELQKEIDNNLINLFELENRFMSHITLARVKHVYDKKELIDYLRGIKPRKIKFKIDKFVLKSSDLNPEGPVYKDIKIYGLKSWTKIVVSEFIL